MRCSILADFSCDKDGVLGRHEANTRRGNCLSVSLKWWLQRFGEWMEMVLEGRRA